MRQGRAGTPSAELRATATGLVGQALLVVSGPLAARLLGPAGRGELALTMLLVSLALQIALLGSPAALAYFLPRSGLGILSAVANWRAIYIATTVVTVTGLICTLAILRSNGRLHYGFGTIGAAVALTLVLLIVQLLTALTQGARQFLSMDLIRVSPAFAYLATLLSVSLYRGAATVLHVILGFALFTSILLVVLLPRTRRALRSIPGCEGASPSRQVFVRFGLASMLATAAPLDNVGLDQLTVGAVLGPAALGIYVVGGAFANLCNILVASLTMVAIPRIAGLSDTNDVVLAVRRYVGVGLATIIVATGLLELCLPLVLVRLFGPEYAASLPIGRILVLAGAALSVRRLLGGMLQAVGTPGWFGTVEIASAVCLAITCSVATPKFGLNGAAGALLLTAVASAITLAFALRFRLRRIVHISPAGFDIGRHADVPPNANEN